MRAERSPGRSIVGLDFSGAVAAGKAIWIAEGREARGQFVLEACRPALELAGGGALRSTALPAVVRHLSGLGDAVVGCDFPFSLPADMVGASGWRGFLQEFPSRYRSAEAFRDAARAEKNGREERRECDREASTPFCAWNLRLYRQTWHGIADILRPLALEHGALVLPMDAAEGGRLWLAETCPASFLKRIRLYKPYKGRGPAQRAMRAEVLARLVADKLLAAPASQLERRLLDDSGGDALDAVIAAVTTWLNWRDGILEQPARSPAERVEGRVYF